MRFIGSHSGFIHPMHIHGGPFEVVASDGETRRRPARYRPTRSMSAPVSATM